MAILLGLLPASLRPSRKRASSSGGGRSGGGELVGSSDGGGSGGGVDLPPPPATKRPRLRDASSPSSLSCSTAPPSSVDTSPPSSPATSRLTTTPASDRASDHLELPNSSSFSPLDSPRDDGHRDDDDDENPHSSSHDGRTVDDDDRAYESRNESGDDLPVVVDSPSRRPNEYFAAVSAARSRLRAAKATAARDRFHLARAREDCDRSRREAERAEAYLRGVERRWGVVDVDRSADEADGGRGDEGGGEGFSDEVALVTADRGVGDNVATVAGAPHSLIRRIEVRGAGESIVNGTYDLCPSSVGAEGPAYVREGGPIATGGSWHDVCLFRRTGYGTRIRWCVGLLPRLDRDGVDDDDGDSNDDRDGSCVDDLPNGRWDLARAYVYYWAEVDRDNEGGEPPLDAPAAKDEMKGKRWGACHGERPTPLLRDATASARGSGWWRFWRG